MATAAVIVGLIVFFLVGVGAGSTVLHGTPKRSIKEGRFTVLWLSIRNARVLVVTENGDATHEFYSLNFLAFATHPGYFEGKTRFTMYVRKHDMGLSVSLEEDVTAAFLPSTLRK